MKRTVKQLAALLAVLALTVCGTAAMAKDVASVYREGSYATAADRIIDKAGIWSDRTEEELRLAAAQLAERYRTDIVLLSVYLLQDASLGERVYSSIRDFADDYYDANAYGCGGERSGMILVISMEAGNRQYHVSTAGREYEEYSEADIGYLTETLQPLLTGGSYDGAAKRFLELAEEHEQNGSFDVPEENEGDFSDLLWGSALAVIVAWAVTSNMKRRMRPVHTANMAQNFIVDGSYELRGYNELFLGSSVTRTEKQKKTDSGGGGGHISSSGSSHGGGGGHF